MTGAIDENGPNLSIPRCFERLDLAGWHLPDLRIARGLKLSLDIVQGKGMGGWKGVEDRQKAKGKMLFCLYVH
ncbi:hypothetical protein [Bradyrhizobium sp. 27S5]|uniref:hypothetical protein n=1 Tax=Bradyrhizobium sp. 27S5 TaxID=3139728 RepID=UPI0030D26112